MATYPNINRSKAQTKYNVTYSKGRAIKHIVIHYTGTTASASNNCTYFGGGNRNASADYFIDKDGAIWQFNGDIRNYYSWHCGDGGGKYGITNGQSIGIEVVSAGEDFTEAQINSLNQLVVALMQDYGVTADRVVRHYDASRKLCPAPYAGDKNNSKWLALRARITEDDIVTPQDKQDIVNLFLNTKVDGQTIQEHILYAHRDSEWMKYNRTSEKIADTVWKYQVEKKDGSKQKMWAQDYLAWTNYDTSNLGTWRTKVIELLNSIISKLAK